MSTKRNKCKDKLWCWNCDDCQNKHFTCFECNENIT